MADTFGKIRALKKKNRTDGKSKNCRKKTAGFHKKIIPFFSEFGSRFLLDTKTAICYSNVMKKIGFIENEEILF